jgi:cbb3-type cytochrome oxidase subunit 1
VTLGIAMAIWPTLIIYRPAHVHMNLLGFVTMMIFGVGYHVLPRFAGSPLRWEWLPPVHWWLSNVGLLLMVTGFFVIPSNPLGRWIFAPGGTLAAIGAFCFIVNIWRTVDGVKIRTVTPPPPRKNLPVNQGG